MKLKDRFPQSQLGFTLVEVVTVLVIISILAMFVAPEVLNWRPNMRLTDSAQDLYANMQNAKVAAVEKNTRVVMSFDIAGNTYEIFVDDGQGGGTANDDTRNGGEEYLSFDEATNTYGPMSLEPGIVFDAASDFSGTTTPGFTPRGMPLAGRTGEIQLRLNDSSKWYRIQLKTAGGLGMQRKTSASASWE